MNKKTEKEHSHTQVRRRTVLVKSHPKRACHGIGGRDEKNGREEQRIMEVAGRHKVACIQRKKSKQGGPASRGDGGMVVEKHQNKYGAGREGDTAGMGMNTGMVWQEKAGR